MNWKIGIEKHRFLEEPQNFRGGIKCIFKKKIVQNVIARM